MTGGRTRSRIPPLCRTSRSCTSSYLPELGPAATAPDRQAGRRGASDPRQRQLRGKRTLWDGRAQVRAVLYMAALPAAKFNPVLNAFSLRLQRAGSPRKRALTAVIRKLLIILNAM